MAKNDYISKPVPVPSMPKIYQMNGFNLTAYILNVTKEAQDQQKLDECKRYGTFMKSVPRSRLEAIFWVPFVTVFILLILAALSHQKSEQTYMHGKHHPEEAADMKLKQRR